MNNYLNLLGLATRARSTVSGETLIKGIQSKNVCFVVIALDASENAKKKITDKCQYYGVFQSHTQSTTTGPAPVTSFPAAVNRYLWYGSTAVLTTPSRSDNSFTNSAVEKPANSGFITTSYFQYRSISCCIFSCPIGFMV